MFSQYIFEDSEIGILYRDGASRVSMKKIILWCVFRENHVNLWPENGRTVQTTY